MNNKEFLTWIHNRLIEVHGENRNSAYMHKLNSVIESVGETERDLYTLKADYSMHLDQLRDLLLEIRTGGQAHIECTDRTSPTGLLIKELCNTRN